MAGPPMITARNDEDPLSSCEFLDAAFNAWMEGPEMITPRLKKGLAVVDGQLWAFGGPGIASCERLDAASKVWVAGPDLPVITSLPSELRWVVN